MEIAIEKLPKSIEQLQEIIVLQQQEIEKHKQEILSYKERYNRLLEAFKLEKHHRFAPSSEKNVYQPDLFDEPGEIISEEVKAQLDDTIAVKNHARKKHPVRRPLPSDIPREVVVHDIQETDKICHCGKSLVRIGEEISEQLKYIPAKLTVLQHVRPKYACKPCQENVKIAAMPSLLLPKSLATPELIAYTIISKYGDHIPLYRQEAIWERLGIDMPRSSLCGWLMKVSEICDPLLKLLQKEIMATDYIQADETTVQVLEEVGRTNQSQSYMWCYRTGGKKPNIVYEYQPTCGGYHAEEFLTGFKGYLQTDAYAGYNFASKNPAIIKVGCMAHARRKFTDAAKITSVKGLSHEAITFFAALYKIEKDARENKLSTHQRQDVRNKKARPLLTAFKSWLDCHYTKVPVQSKIGEAIHYALSNWTALTNYLLDGRIEIDNNLLENAIRPFALGRKNWLFKGSPKGAKAGALFYSLIETCKANGIEPYQYFVSMLNRIPTCRTDDEYRKLLPCFIEIN